MNIDEHLSKGVDSFFFDRSGEEDFVMHNRVTTYHFPSLTGLASK